MSSADSALLDRGDHDHVGSVWSCGQPAAGSDRDGSAGSADQSSSRPITSGGDEPALLDRDLGDLRAVRIGSIDRGEDGGHGVSRAYSDRTLGLSGGSWWRKRLRAAALSVHAERGCGGNRERKGGGCGRRGASGSRSTEDVRSRRVTAVLRKLSLATRSW